MGGEEHGGPACAVGLAADIEDPVLDPGSVGKGPVVVCVAQW